MNKKKVHLINHLVSIIEEITHDMKSVEFNTDKECDSFTQISSNQLKLSTGLIQDILDMSDDDLELVSKSTLSAMVYGVSHKMETHEHGA